MYYIYELHKNNLTNELTIFTDQVIITFLINLNDTVDQILNELYLENFKFSNLTFLSYCLRILIKSNSRIIKISNKIKFQ